ncbi:MAG: hypothetical protein E7164_02490 [Firmicutes bacterium]|nr:hypothetical protein [Bacillota bacterium]
MNCSSILIICSSYVVLNHRNKKYRLDLSRNVIDNGIIIDNQLFSKAYLKFIKKNHTYNFWKKNSITIIYNVCNNRRDIENLYHLFKELNYINIYLVEEKKLLNLKLSTNYLLVDKSIRLFYIDKYNQKKVLVLNPEILSNSEICKLIASRSSNRILNIVGDEDQKWNFPNLNYYVFDQLSEFFFEKYMSISKDFD